MLRGCPYVLNPTSEISLPFLLKQLQYLCDYHWLSHSFKVCYQPQPFLCLSPLGEPWCDVFGLVPTYSISSSSTLLISWDASHIWWLLCPPVRVLVHFPWLQPVDESAHRGVFGSGNGMSSHALLCFPFCFCLFSSHWIYENTCMCMYRVHTVFEGLWKFGENHLPFSRPWRSGKNEQFNWGLWKLVNLGFCWNTSNFHDFESS